MSKQPHTEFRKGQRVMVIFRDGSSVVGKYVDKFSNGIRLDIGEFKTKYIRQVTIFRDKSAQEITEKEE